MNVGVLMEMRVRAEQRERFLLATSLYAQHTRDEATRPRVEVLECEGGSEFCIRELYSNEAALEEHARAEHARQWLATVSELVEGTVVARRIARLIGEPPALPRPPRAALETATALPSTHREASARGSGGSPERPSIPLRLPRLQVMVERVEVASAQDGFLRGAPDLCLLAGCYLVAGHEAKLLGRAVYRFELGSAAPCEVIRRDQVLDLPVLVEQFPLRVYVAVLAFEENGGSDVRSAYRDLSEPGALFFWSSLQDEPNPIALAQHAAQLRPNDCERVQTLSGSGVHGDAARDDSWVGAASGLVEFTGQGQDRLLRCHTRSRDGKNDWLWELSLRF